MAAPRQRRRLFFHGTGGTLFGIHVVNVLLTIVTFGVYYFWAKTRVRVYMLSQAEFEGDRLAWHGTAKELLIGFSEGHDHLLHPPDARLSFIQNVPEVSAPLQFMAAILGYALVVVVLPLAMVGSRRYRLSRISWRGIRFSFRGPAWDFVKIFFVGSILTSLTLGLYYPFFDTRRYAFMTAHAWFGNRRFRFDGEGRELFRPFLLTLLLVLPTLGLALFWYWARRRRFFWDHTSVDEARFRCTVAGGRLALLMLGNVALLVCTLGLAWPWVKVRTRASRAPT